MAVFGLLCSSGPVAGIIHASRYELDFFFVFFCFFRNANLKRNKVGINEVTEGERKAAICEGGRVWRHDVSQQTRF